MKPKVKKNLFQLIIPTLSVGWYFICFELYLFVAQHTFLFLISDDNRWVFTSCGGYMGRFHNHASFATAFGLCLYFTLFFWWGKPKKMLLFACINTLIQAICVFVKVLYLRYEVLERMIEPGQNSHFMNLYMAAFVGFHIAIVLNGYVKKRLYGYVIKPLEWGTSTE